VNWGEIRAEFPALRNVTYLNSATYGQLALRTQAAVSAHFARRDEFACEDFLTWFGDMDELRALIGQLIHCEADDISFAANASSALSLFLGGVDWTRGDRIVTLANEFPNQYYYANSLGERGVELVELADLTVLPPQTRAVVLSTVNYMNGYRPDVAAICRMAHAAGALVYVDGTQSVGALRFDVGQVRPDMLAVDGYKWLLCPNGATFFYVSPALRRTLQPAVIGWRSDRGWRSVNDLNHGTPRFPEAAERYEGGMLNFPSLYGMAEAVRMVLEIGPDRIEERVLALAGETEDILRASGAGIVHAGSNIVAAHWPDRDASVLAGQLAEKKVLAAARHGNLRVSPHFYNDEADLAALASVVQGL
jgi:cysteine desulfurase/selenocysteine lyase